MKKTLIKRIISAVLIAAAVLLTYSSVYVKEDLQVSDALYQSGGSGFMHIIIVGIDEEDIDEYGNPAGWNRGRWADILSCLCDADCSPSVVGIDVMFTGHRDGNPADEGDAALVEAVEALTGNGTDVVIADQLKIKLQAVLVGAGNSVSMQKNADTDDPYDELLNVSQTGYINAFTDEDGIVRHARLSYVDFYESFDAVIAKCYAEQHPEKYPDGISEKAENDVWYIQYSETAKETSSCYTQYSVHELLNGQTDEGSVITAENFGGSIVIFGAHASGMQDEYYTSIDHVTKMYGINIHANIIDDLLDQDTAAKTEASDTLQRGILLLSLIILAFAFSKLKIVPSALIWIGTCAGSIGLCLLAYQAGMILHPLYFPIGCTLLLISAACIYYAEIWAEKKAIREKFSQYVDPSLMKDILSRGEQSLNPEGRTRQAAILFVDICGFTHLSEVLNDPELVVQVLNEYLTIITECIEPHGVLDKFIGDAAMAFWCGPDGEENDLLGDPQYLEHAIASALEMKARAPEMQEKLLSAVHALPGAEADEETIRRELSGIGFAVGINCGPAVIGNIGSNRRMDYTAIGSTVNYASRLEGLKIDGRERSGDIYISEAVKDALKQEKTIPEGWRIEPLGEYPIKGMVGKQKVYRITAD